MKSLIPSVLVAVLIIGGAVLLSGGGEKTPSAGGGVSIVDGRQTVEILAKGGYYPASVEAKSDMPTVLKMKTSGTFDCSAALTIPALGYREILANNGETLIDIPAQAPGSVIDGICSMGMYSFQIRFI